MATLRARSLLFDTDIAAVALAMSLGAMGHGGWNRDHTGSADHRLDALGVALALAMALPLVARRIWPVPVLAVVAPATVPSLARHGFGPGVFAGTVVWALAWFAGDRMRQRHERIASAAERARQAEREAERERRLASAEERTRIARDLHDSAGHAVNVILVQAGAARLLLEQDPARSRAALRTIEDVARETLVEIDQLVRALRDPGGTDGVEPPAGLAALDTLTGRGPRVWSCRTAPRRSSSW